MTSAHEPPIRVMALHALAYCERLFYLEEVEEIRLADEAVFAGRALHEDLKRLEEDALEWTNRKLSSEDLGLVGQVDVIRRRDGVLIPYEHKRGRSCRQEKKPTAWLSDAIQVTAYAMLLEEEEGCIIPEGRVRYHAENITVRVPVDDEARRKVLSALDRARQVRRQPQRPPVTSNDRLCLRCSLAPVCLPEEERLAADPSWDPIRLFPADKELKTVHVLTNGARISRSGETLRLMYSSEEAQTLPIREIGSLVLHGYPQLTTQGLHFCARNEVQVHWVSAGGRYVAGLSAGGGGVHRRLRQYGALSDPDFCLSLTRKLVMAKVEGALRYVLRATRGMDREESKIASHIETFRSSLKSMSKVESPDEIRGYEGLAGRAYFAVLPSLLRGQIPREMVPVGRSRRPPRDRFNALLSFGYSLLYQSVLQSILTVGLEPALGFYHRPRSSAHPLVLDLMELFRVPICDMALVGSVNRLQWDPAADFDVAGERIWLSLAGRKKAIQVFERRLQDSWRHPAIGYSLSYARLIELEVRLLEKEWAGQPGLFARMRLR